MNNKRSLLISISLLVSVLTGVLVANFFRLSDTHAQLKVSGQPWEYAALTGIRQPDGPNAEICLFTETGCEQFLFITGSDSKGLQGTATQNAIAKAIYAMGAAGWEMVSGADVPVATFDPKKHSFVTNDHIVGFVISVLSLGLVYRQNRDTKATKAQQLI